MVLFGYHEIRIGLQWIEEMRASSTRRVTFDSMRRLEYDEVSVMEHYSRHASHCRRCMDPCKVVSSGDTLYERGRAYARDVMQYIFSKDGKPFSVVDQVQIEIPTQLSVIPNLLKAIEQGLGIGKGETIPQKIFHRVRAAKRNHYDIVEVQDEDCKAGQYHHDRGRKVAQTKPFAKESNDEQSVIFYARLLPEVVKLELKPINYRKMESRQFRM